MAEIKSSSGKQVRAFICQTINEYGYPAKDRSGRLNIIEEPHLGKLMQKIAAKPLDATAEALTATTSSSEPATPSLSTELTLPTELQELTTLPTPTTINEVSYE